MRIQLSDHFTYGRLLRFTLPSMAMMVVLGEDLAVLMFGQREAGEFLLPLAAAMIFGCYQGIFSGVLSGTNRQGQSAVISLLCDVVQLVFVFTIPQIGIKGFVGGTLISSLLGAGLCAGCAAKVTGVKLPVFECVTAPVLGAALVGLTGNMLFRYLKDSGCEILISGGITLLYGVVLYIGALQAQGISLRNVFHLRADQQRK